MDLVQTIRRLASTQYQDIVALRRHIHAHPELSFEEKETAALVARELEYLGIDVQPHVAGHGVVGLLKGDNISPNSPTIALRADMDALPIHEENEVDYRSANPGVMHACGHDVHTSSLLGTARILSQLKSELAGTIKFIFQPAEEKFPGGASLMIKAGVLEHPHVDAIIGQHVQPYIEHGKVGIRSGMYMASADEIYLTVRGKGGHAAHPATFIDPVTATAQILVALQQVVSRSDPRIPSVLSFGKIIAEGATNVIPDQVYVEGTFRTMDEPWRAEAHLRIERIIKHTAEAFGCVAELNLVKGYPVLFNDEAVTARTKAVISSYVGEENVQELDLWMAAEDFAYYTHEAPGCFYRLGTRNEARGIVHGLHTSRFDIEESALEVSTGLMAWVAINELRAQASRS
ncbi:MAG: amidohydrolase [Bacteroidia bacterium]|nr:amidohydrolase [Bacteroidia bacterium]